MKRSRWISLLLALFCLSAVGAAMASPEAQQSAQREAEAHYGRAQYYLALRDLPKAIESLREALKASPGHRAALSDLLDCLTRQGDFTTALRYAEDWLAVNPGDGDIAARRAVLAAKAPPAPATPAASPRPASRSTQPVSLADYAKEKGTGVKAPPKGQVIELYGEASEGGGGEVPAVPDDAPRTTLDSMRQRAEKVFRARMEPIASDVRQFKASVRRFEDACLGKYQVSDIEGSTQGSGGTTGAVKTRSGRIVGYFNSQSSWEERFSGISVRSNMDTPECRLLESDIRNLAARLAAAMKGVDTELAMPPSVYPGIREEVFRQLAAELW
jgi:tetratricopeptide (TPR) repeat protein